MWIKRYEIDVKGDDVDIAEYKNGWLMKYEDHEAALSAKDEEIERLRSAHSQAAHEFLRGLNRECCGYPRSGRPDEEPECCGEPTDDFDKYQARVAEILAQPSEHEATGEGK